MTERAFLTFAHRVSYDGDCWIWRKSKIGPYRHSYEVFRGPIRSPYIVHHRCQQRRCVNPHHLELVTPMEHARRHAALDGRLAGWIRREQEQELSYRQGLATALKAVRKIEAEIRNGTRTK